MQAQKSIASKRLSYMVGGEIDAPVENNRVYVKYGGLSVTTRNPKQAAYVVEIRKRINKTRTMSE